MSDEIKKYNQDTRYEELEAEGELNDLLENLHTADRAVYKAKIDLEQAECDFDHAFECNGDKDATKLARAKAWLTWDAEKKKRDRIDAQIIPAQRAYCKAVIKKYLDLKENE